MMTIMEGGLDDPRVDALLQHHLEHARAQTAPGSTHALDLEGLKAPGVTFWTVWEDDTLLGTGALKQFSPEHAEVKSMHTVHTMRRKGAGRAMLHHIIAVARERGLTRLCLETGSWNYFLPARLFYRAQGFVDCGPFGQHEPDPNSVFMELDLTAIQLATVATSG